MKHTIKATDGTTIEVDDYTRAKAIKTMCWECMGWQGNPKDECTSPTCPLYPFRGLSLAASPIKAQAARESAEALRKNPIHRLSNRQTKEGWYERTKAR